MQVTGNGKLLAARRNSAQFQIDRAAVVIRATETQGRKVFVIAREAHFHRRAVVRQQGVAYGSILSKSTAGKSQKNDMKLPQHSRRNSTTCGQTSVYRTPWQ